MLKFIFAASAAMVGALELTPETYSEQTAGKTVFLKFFAPWCGHCKKMKPTWDGLMTEFEGNDKILVADVDCTAGGKPLCDANGVKGFPTLKFGDPNNLEDYEGGRDESALKKFASDLKPACSPANLAVCDEEGKATIEKLMALSDEEIATQIADGDKKLKDAETTFETELETLQATYKALQTAKEDTIAEVKKSGLGMLKAVQSHKKNAAAPAKEEL